MKYKIIIGIVCVLAVGGATWAFLAARTPEASNENDADSALAAAPAASTAADEHFHGTLSELTDAGKDMRCEFTHSVEGASSTGEVFVSGGKLRADVDTKAAGLTVRTHVVREEGWLYGWSDMLPGKGYKISATPEAVAEAQQGNSQTFDYDQEFEFHCGPWTPDLSVFEIPADITFTAGAPKF